MSVDNRESNIKLDIPSNFTDNEVIFKINKKKEAKVTEQTFRSFSFLITNEDIIIDQKKIPTYRLFNILRAHGLSDTIPIYVSPTEKALNPDHKFIFKAFDWKPIAYMGPTVWYFTWDNIKCSITGHNANSLYSSCTSIYIRIHDMTPGLGEKIIDDIISELLTYWVDPVPKKTLIIYTSQRNIGGYTWSPLCTRTPRDISTIYLDSNIKSKLVNQLKKFYESNDLYDKYGVTWKRIHLFYGPPGSGKTSTVLALASLFNKNICKVTITPDLNSQDIELLFQSVPDNSFMLVEDVDALFTERKTTLSIDFSTLLNCMDGLSTKRGLVLFMTTNYIDKLDAAFIRPGRVDLCLEFKLPGREELSLALKTLGSQYAPEHEEFLNKHCENMSIASLQKHLFECIMDNKQSILM